MQENKLNILVVEDEDSIVEVIKAYLIKEGYGVIETKSGKEAIKILDELTISCVILDLMLPDLSGEEVCKSIRKKSQVPILMLTAKVEEEDKIYGLNIGADDYITKPFSPKELVARIKAVLRRNDDRTIKSSILEFNDTDLKIYLDNMEVLVNQKLVELTMTEFKLLNLLASNAGKVFSREELVIKILGYDYEGYDRTIDTHIKNLRQKIEKNNKYIITVYGAGYKFMGD
ncbi:response regulator transcription factor [Serpentinicella alkaliphila]|uniref:Stage 0 sporulation protein A homolog n=1 Tax=Serpentinicella alkaliphila TaxID=1734049 RepID=A0A4R2T5U7_9FIRM|nr:response regulator transcription factor [Serpentinicella alkaliphila]QUH25606.1 response regulator transcription factor [Serpentinicella alkaliphila]TCP98387.1 DNA-binding response OmpR family regulator [Serpentinicella alkaliphila]